MPTPVSSPEHLHTGSVKHCSFTDVLPKMAVFSHEQPLGLHLQFEPLNRLDHGIRREQLAGGTTQTIQLPPGRVGAERHLLFGGSFGHTELVIAAQDDGRSIHYTRSKLNGNVLDSWNSLNDTIAVVMCSDRTNDLLPPTEPAECLLPLATSVFTLKSSGVRTWLSHHVNPRSCFSIHLSS